MDCLSCTCSPCRRVHLQVCDQLQAPELLLMQAEKVDTLPNGRQLTYGEYRDVGRPLRRMLKQLGAGSLEKGLAALNSSEGALQEVAQLVHVEPAVSPPLLQCPL